MLTASHRRRQALDPCATGRSVSDRLTRRARTPTPTVLFAPRAVARPAENPASAATNASRGSAADRVRQPSSSRRFDPLRVRLHHHHDTINPAECSISIWSLCTTASLPAPARNFENPARASAWSGYPRAGLRRANPPRRPLALLSRPREFGMLARAGRKRRTAAGETSGWGADGRARALVAAVACLRLPALLP